MTFSALKNEVRGGMKSCNTYFRQSQTYPIGLKRIGLIYDSRMHQSGVRTANQYRRIGPATTPVVGMHLKRRAVS